MRDKNFSHVCAAAVGHWGTNLQLNQAQEEAAELIAAISHFRRSRAGSREELIEEIADVEIMIGQLRFILGDEEINDAIAEKLKRLCERLGIEYKNGEEQGND